MSRKMTVYDLADQSTTASTTNTRPPSLAEIQEAKRLLEAQPKPKWALVAPDGRVWMHEDPAELLPILMPYHPFLKGILP